MLIICFSNRPKECINNKISLTFKSLCFLTYHVSYQYAVFSKASIEELLKQTQSVHFEETDITKLLNINAYCIFTFSLIYFEELCGSPVYIVDEATDPHPLVGRDQFSATFFTLNTFY